ncbi:hypothetical protein HanXRQr2_Chr10g0432511 [Helianthus annuus]|uniref:Uncharacterized protein n=1 Tax=Helianthus annuus TaxID=4232 RepID=A0A9K3N3M5_HELAN|nr:hypothetical protein HanXRQr2_Chr10g0432511 [Helianthus annuus]
MSSEVRTRYEPPLDWAGKGFILALMAAFMTSCTERQGKNATLRPETFIFLLHLR